VRIPIEQNIWRWVWLGVAILVLTLAIALAMNKAPHRRSPRAFGPHLGTVVAKANVSGATNSSRPMGNELHRLLLGGTTAWNRGRMLCADLARQ